jgi:hypothetical protein
MFKRGFLFACFVFAPALLAAEPTPKIKALMDEPVSLFDWGIFQIAQQLSNLKVAGEDVATSAAYDWSTNMIKVVFAGSNFKATGKEEAKNTCKEIIVEVKSHLYIDHFTGKPHSVGGLFKNSFIATAFSHAGFQRTTWPEGVAEEVENIMVIKGMVSFRPGTGGYVECESPLLSSKVLFVE